MLHIEEFRSRLAEVKDNPTEVAKLAAEVTAGLSICLQEVAPYLPADSSLIANSRVKEDRARIEKYLEALLRWRDQNPNPERLLTIVAPITGHLLADGLALLGETSTRPKGNVLTAFVFMNARDYAYIRKFGRDLIDIESRAEYLKMGVTAYIWGATIVIKKEIPTGFVYIVPELGDDGTFPVVGVMSVIR